jgi:hypothetical protein
MPIEFYFRRLSDNKMMDLNKIDELICNELEIPVKEDEFSDMFELISIIGDQMGNNWDENKFRKITERLWETLNPEKHIKLIRKFLHEEYKYTSCHVYTRRF